jgi:hypothetical protein
LLQFLSLMTCEGHQAEFFAHSMTNDCCSGGSQIRHHPLPEFEYLTSDLAEESDGQLIKAAGQNPLHPFFPFHPRINLYTWEGSITLPGSLIDLPFGPAPLEIGKGSRFGGLSG